MEIETPDPMLPYRLQSSAPAGVIVTFDPPHMARNLEAVVATVIVTLHFAAEVDLKAVACWLAEKLSPNQDAYKSTERTKTEVEIMGLIKVSHESKKEKVRSPKGPNRG